MHNATQETSVEGRWWRRRQEARAGLQQQLSTHSGKQHTMCIEGRNEGRKEGREDGGKEGRKEGSKQAMLNRGQTHADTLDRIRHGYRQTDRSTNTHPKVHTHARTHTHAHTHLLVVRTPTARS